MDQKWIQMVVILLFYQKMTPGAGETLTVTEGDEVDITCDPKEMGSVIIWFRVLDSSGMQFIASFDNRGQLRSSGDSFSSTFSDKNMGKKVLTLKRFSESRDSGFYSCGSLYKGNELKFGKTTRLVAKKAPPPITTTQQPETECTTAAACVCNNSNQKGETNPSMFCSIMILGPLAGGCGLLLLLLIVTILYCNKIRTRRCPHHYKRKPRMPPGKEMINRRA